MINSLAKSHVNSSSIKWMSSVRYLTKNVNSLIFLFPFDLLKKRMVFNFCFKLLSFNGLQFCFKKFQMNLQVFVTLYISVLLRYTTNACRRFSTRFLPGQKVVKKWTLPFPLKSRVGQHFFQIFFLAYSNLKHSPWGNSNDTQWTLYSARF